MTDLFGLKRLPLADWVDNAFSFIRQNYRPQLRSLSGYMREFIDFTESVLTFSAVATFAVIVLLSLLFAGWRAGLFSFAGLAFIMNLGLWELAMKTLALVFCSALICVAFGIPVGILMARSETAKALIRPVLDLMQTMPAFVYLIPAVSFFGLGTVSGLMATVMFAFAPIVRLTAHGIEQVDREMVEASEAFGANTWQTLFKVQLPLARPSIMVGVNQTLLLSLSMIVIASMVGTDSLGSRVLASLTRVSPGMGFEAGISLVILAVILDRITQGLGKRGAGTETPGFFEGMRGNFERVLSAIVGGPRNRRVDLDSPKR